MITSFRHRPLSIITKEIIEDWKNVDSHTYPSLITMSAINQIEKCHKNVILYFLSCAQHWRGDKAREIKKELKSILKNITKNKVDVHKYAYERKDWDRER